ncbi:MAG: hypothetical protein Kow0074_08040 [Candidatus Zixiibacteriota bacterium]
MRSDRTPIDSSFYRLDADHGVLTFSESLSVYDTVIVLFQRLAFPLATDWTTIDTPPERAGTAAVRMQHVAAVGYVPGLSGTPRARQPAFGTDGQTLEWQGLKSFSVTTSSARGADWSQGLELSLEGNISEDVRVRGAVSDRFANTLSNRSRGPVTRVGDLDRLFLEAQSQRFFGRFGQVSLPGMSAGEQGRDASGAQFSWTGAAHAVDGYAGLAAGTPVRRRLATQPQIAGPYPLSGEGTFGTVIPSSIVVTKDGARLTEGANADYTFDAATGSITFGPSAVPDAASIVIVEYEHALDQYRRTLAGMSWDAGTSRSVVRNRFAARWEADDPGRPLFGELSGDQRAVLAQSPNGTVSIPSHEYHGTNEGDYDLSMTDDGDTVFVYVGPGNGDWRVGFEHVGFGHGRYRHLAEDAFEYAGVNQGSYEPIATLGAPRSFMTVSESVQLNATPLGSFEAQWHGFIDDPNRLAAGNTQVKSNHHLGWSTITAASIEDADRLRMDWWRHEAIADRTRAVDDFGRFTHAWQLRDSLFDLSRNEYQLTASSSRQRRLSASIESGLLNSLEVDAVRWSVAADARPTSDLTTRAEWTQRMARPPADPRSAHDVWRDLRTSARYEYRKWSLSTRWSRRDLENSHRTFGNGPRYVGERSLALGFSEAMLEYKWVDSYDSLSVRRRTRELSLSTPIDVVPSLEGNLLIARGEQVSHSGELTPYYRGRLDAGWTPGASVAINADMDLAYTRAGVEQEIYLPTRPGQGQYRLERGEYVPDAHGDYRRVVSRSDQQGPESYDARQTIYGHWRPTIGGWRWALQSRRDRLARHDPAGFSALTWLAPWTSYTWDLAPGARAERHDYHRLSVRPNAFTECSIDWASDHTVFGIDRVRNIRDRIGSTVRRDVSNRLYLEAGGELEVRERSGGSRLTVDADASTLRLALGGTPRPRVTWLLEGRRRRDLDHVSNVEVRLFGLRPRAQAVFGAVTVLVESDLTWVQPRTRGTIFSSLLAEGRPAGLSSVEFCEVRWQLPKRITLTSRFHADLREGDDDRWRWDVQTVARF